MIVYFFERLIFRRITCYKISESDCGKSNECIIEAIQICPLVFNLIKYRCVKRKFLVLHGKIAYQYNVIIGNFWIDNADSHSCLPDGTKRKIIIPGIKKAITCTILSKSWIIWLSVLFMFGRFSLNLLSF